MNILPLEKIKVVCYNEHTRQGKPTFQEYLWEEMANEKNSNIQQRNISTDDKANEYLEEYRRERQNA